MWGLHGGAKGAVASSGTVGILTSHGGEQSDTCSAEDVTLIVDCGFGEACIESVDRLRDSGDMRDCMEGLHGACLEGKLSAGCVACHLANPDGAGCFPSTSGNSDNSAGGVILTPPRLF